jgi:hypothetical protein
MSKEQSSWEVHSQDIPRLYFIFALTEPRWKINFYVESRKRTIYGLAGMSFDIVKYTGSCYYPIALKRVITLFLLRIESVCFIFCVC